MTKRIFTETAEGEEYLHRQLWNVVRRQLAYASAPANQRGALYDDLVAMVFATHCLEGYLNFVGDKIAPSFWEKERKHFRAEGFMGKLGKVLELCAVPPFKEDERPWLTILTLKDLRDGIAHPKTRKEETSTDHEEGDEPSMFPESYLETVVTHAKAVEAMEDVKAVADCIHAAATARFPDRALGSEALEGISAFRTSSSALKL